MRTHGRLFRIVAALTIASVGFGACSSDDGGAVQDPVTSSSGPPEATGTNDIATDATHAASTDAATTAPPPTLDPAEEVRREGADAFAVAIDELAMRPATNYEMELTKKSPRRSNDRDGRVKIGEVRFTASNSGLVRGAGRILGQAIDLVIIDDDLYIRAGAAQWRALGADRARAREFGGELTVLSPAAIGIDLRTALAPDVLAERLVTTFTDDADITLTDLDDGTPVYRLTEDGSSVDVSLEEPSEIVGTDLPLLLPEGSTPEFSLDVGSSSTTELTLTTVEDLEALRNARDVGIERGKLLNIGDVRIEVVPAGAGVVNCTRGTGSCTVTGGARNTVVFENAGASDYLEVDSVKIHFVAKANGGVLGTASCSGTRQASPNSETSIGCPFRVASPPGRGPYPIQVETTFRATARVRPNVRALTEYLEKEVALLEDLIERLYP